jgi:hypothetical protein
MFRLQSASLYQRPGWAVRVLGDALGRSCSPSACHWQSTPSSASPHPERTFFHLDTDPRYNHRSQMFRWSQVLFLAIDRLAPDPLDMIELPGTGPLCSGARFNP